MNKDHIERLQLNKLIKSKHLLYIFHMIYLSIFIVITGNGDEL